MSRPPRIEIPDGVYHIVARGNERKTIYRDDVDHARFLETLRGTADRHGWRVLAYCLMSNHYHQLLSTPNANLARGMRDLNGGYAQAFNRRHGRDGHLFQGRYKAVLVQADEHMLAAVRYIIRNPVRAGVTEHVEQWPWTSHAATIGRTPPGFLAIDQLLSHFAANRATARRRYLELLDSEPDPPAPEHPIIAGDTTFVATQLQRIRPSPEHPRKQITPVPLSLDELLSTSSNASAIVRAHQTGYSMRQIATHLHCGVTTIHRRIRQHEHANGTRKT